MRDIAVASGLTVGGVYAHWNDKETIWGAVLDVFHPLRKLLPVFRSTNAATVEELFSELAYRIVETLGTHRDALNLLFTELVEFQGSHFVSVFPDLFPSFVASVRETTERTGAVLPYPPEVVVRSFFGLIFSYFMTSIVLPGNFPENDESLDVFVKIYLHGMVGSNAAKTQTKDGTA